jgi:hypothetical protein
MTLRQFGLILFIGLVFEVTAFAICYDDLIYLRRPISELLIAGPQPFVRHATDALARPALTPAHVNTIAEVAHNFRLTELEIAALERRGTMSPFDRSARLRLAEALRERGDLAHAERILVELLEAGQ